MPTPRGWPGGGTSWAGGGVDVPSPSTPAWKLTPVGPQSPLAVAVSPTVSPDATLASSKDSDQQHGWNFTPPLRNSSSAKAKPSGGRGRRLWPENERDPAGAAAATTRAAAVGVRSGGPATKAATSACASDGAAAADRRSARRGSERGAGRGRRVVVRQDSWSESGQEEEGLKARVSCAADIPAAKAAAAVGAAAAAATTASTTINQQSPAVDLEADKDGLPSGREENTESTQSQQQQPEAEAATGWAGEFTGATVLARPVMTEGFRVAAAGGVKEDVDAAGKVDQGPSPSDGEVVDGYDLRVVLARMKHLENGWMERAKAYEVRTVLL